ncbi:hypothetical protein EES45_17045 [Streptomyces sp. ADI97-07]|uniref:DUF262 domain-containing protein n=1 Tax=Streptomyces sp. ADI97-07 TaxID=1522762 RepID=UPI000F555201|nr:DUF262 domain-containing protein [Streptomyces sp. ADI97-07]RPK78779.1 hypothetical protein EES45_17045 [Streptomyces sp. ADI97-07]
MKDPGYDNESTREENVQDEWNSLKADIRTHAMDFSIESLVRIFKQGDLVIPAFARPMVWSLTQKSQFIESLLLDIPVPSVFFAENPENYQYSVLDGTQRLYAAISYLDGEYALTGLDSLTSANSLKFDELPPRMQWHLRMSTMRAVIISSTSISDVTATVFSRLNTGGTLLSTQDLRNATLQGPFNSLTIELAHMPDFQQAIGAAGFSRNQRDAELVLRYFALTEGIAHDSMLSQQVLTHFLQTKNYSSQAEIEEYRNSFIDSLHKCLGAFGSESFRRWHPELGRVEKRFSTPVYEAQMLAVRSFHSAEIVEHASKIRVAMRKLFERDEFLKYLKVNTGRSLDARVTAIAEIIESVAR